MNSNLYKLFNLLCVIRFTCIIWNLFLTRNHKSDFFDSRHIKSISLNMSIEEVINQIGQPFNVKINSGFNHSLDCKNTPKSFLEFKYSSVEKIKTNTAKLLDRKQFCCQSNKEDHEYNKIILNYTKPIFFSSHYPELWIHFNDEFKVGSVYSKMYQGHFGLKEKTLYSLQEGELFIEEELLEKCFK